MDLEVILHHQQANQILRNSTNTYPTTLGKDILPTYYLLPSRYHKKSIPYHRGG